MARKRLTLGAFFALATIAVALVVAAALLTMMRRSRATILAESDKLQLAASARVEGTIDALLHRATHALADLERGITAGVIPIDDVESLEAPLLVRLLADDHLEELTFTRADLLGYASGGAAELAEAPRVQVSLQRAPDGRVTTRVARPDPAAAPGAFAASLRHHELGRAFPSAPLVPSPTPATDPTRDLTFSVIASRALRGKVVWSDLHYAEADRALPAPDRRIVLTVQKAIFTAAGQFVGVVRCGLLTRGLDAIGQLEVDPGSPDPQRVALLAATGTGALRLVTRTSEADTLESIDGELRVHTPTMPPELAAALTSPQAAAIDAGAPRAAGVLEVRGVRWRISLARMPGMTGGIAGWVVAVLVVEEHYTRALAATQRYVFWAFAATLLALLLIGGAALLAVRRDLGKIVAATARMRAFDFRPAADSSRFRDVDEAMAGLERAKTVVRAMGKYVPIDLVRRLYAANAEPTLGGEPLEVTILFSDIEGFTSLAETLSVTELAHRLAAYLEVMTDAIEATEGTIDKYIGDAVMAVWNAPSPVARHATAACAAVLACLDATRALYASPRWSGLPPLTTRFGVHRARVLVGHFGAPTRLSYTALGDGVNLAARLEPLCKHYGVCTLVSEDVYQEAKDTYRFRHIDRVAVKGKLHGIDIYELIGPLDQAPPDEDVLAGYERALAAYLARDFAGAARAFAAQADRDPPSAVLAERCRRLEAEPPPESWGGVHVAHHK